MQRCRKQNRAHLKHSKNVRGEQGRISRFYRTAPSIACEKAKVRSPLLFRESDRLEPRSDRGRANCRRHRHRCPCAPGSNPGKIPGDRREAQKALL